MSDIIFHEGFETDAGWTHTAKVFPVGRDPYEAQLGNIFSPEGWLFWFRHKQGEWGQPEARHTWRHVDARRIHDGDGAYMFFGFWRNIDAGLMRQMAVAPGQRVRLTAWQHAWSNWNEGPHPDDGRWSEGSHVGYEVVALRQGTPGLDDGDRNFTSCVGIDPTGGTDPFADTVIWGDAYHIYNGHCHQLSVEAVSEAGAVTVFLRSKTLWAYKHNDAYWDDVELTAIGNEPPPAYDCVTLVLPQSATPEQLAEILRLAYPDRRTFCFSNDDSVRLGGLAILYNIPVARRQEYLDWYSERDPRIEVEFACTSDWDEPAPPPPPPPPDVPVFISFQQQRAADHRDEFISRVQPPAWLLIGGFEEARHLKSLAPNMEVAIRHVDNAWGQYVHASDKDAAAARWLRHYGQTLFDQADCIDWMFDLNEYIATNDYETLRATPSWIEALARRLEREGWPARIVGLNVPVGNPQHNYICDEQGIPRQIPLLTPAVRILTDNDCLTAYHTYWGIRRLGGGRFYSTLDEPASVRMHYAFRALLSWDSVFTAAGVYPKYGFSEGGPIYINEAGVMVSSGAGWKYRETFNGNVDACVASYMQFQDLVQEWNVEHGNRARWLTAFLHGGFTEWRHFDVAGEVSRKLADALAA
jgi:hypothetical protein